MSDELKRRSWAWSWIARSGWIAISLFTLYVASLPPVVQWSNRRGPGDSERRVLPFYRPVFWAMRHSETFEDAFDWYSSHVWGIVYGTEYDDWGYYAED